MPTIPCRNRIICDCQISPWANLSAEAPDVDRFFSIVHFTDTPPISGTWTQAGCLSICVSTISQEDADLCALRQAQQCVWDSGDPWRTAATVTHPNGQPRQIFSNSPQSCVMHCPDGNPFTFTVAGGTFLAFSQVQADEFAHNYACARALEMRVCLSDLFPAIACLSTFYEGTIVATGGALGETNDWAIISGDMPPGLTFHGGTIIGGEALIDGTPTALGVFPFTVQLTTPDGFVVSKAYSLNIACITTNSLPDGAVGTDYSETLTTTGLTAPLIFMVITGELPDGLTLNSETGVISGKPTASGMGAFTVEVTDGNGDTCDKLLTINVTPSLQPQAWWKFEEAGTADRVDAAQGVHLVVGSSSATTVSASAKVNLGLKSSVINSSDGITALSTDFITQLGYDGGGLTIAGWFNISAVVGHVALEYEYDWFLEDFTVAGQLFFNWQSATNVFTVDLVDALSGGVVTEATITVPAGTLINGQWHFFRVWYDPATKKAKLQFDNGTIYSSVQTLSNQLSDGPLGSIDITIGSLTSGIDFVILIDETTLIPMALTTDQANFIWNSGSGQTYPFT